MLPGRETVGMQRVYSNLKVLRHSDPLSALASGRAAPPVHIRIKPTNVCNHDCWFCAYRTSAVTLGEDMNTRDRIPRDKMLEIADDIAEMGVKAVTFSGGGEPLIYPYLTETIERLAAGGVQIAALTNGSQLRGKVADAFAAHGTWIRVSIDGWDGPSYARTRKVKETEFDKVIENIGAFTARGSDCEVGANLIVDRDNASHIAELSATLKRAGARHVKVSACVVSNDGAENNAYHADTADAAREQIELAAELVDETFDVVDHYHTLSDRFDRTYTRCPMVYFLTVIGADLKVYTCHDKAYTASGIVGDISNRRFRDFWMSDEAQARLAAIDPSRDCNHHCVAETKNRALFEILDTDPPHTAFV